MANIIIAEDDKSMAGFLKIALEKAGHSATTFNNGADALEDIESADPPYDLLLTDIVMPGMDGIELSNKAKKTCPALKIMFITGFAAVAVGSKDIDHEKAKILSKPFHLGDLVKQVETMLAA